MESTQTSWSSLAVFSFPGQQGSAESIVKCISLNHPSNIPLIQPPFLQSSSNYSETHTIKLLCETSSLQRPQRPQRRVSKEAGWKEDLMVADKNGLKASRHNDALKLWLLMKGKGTRLMGTQIDTLMKLAL